MCVQQSLLIIRAIRGRECFFIAFSSKLGGSNIAAIEKKWMPRSSLIVHFLSPMSILYKYSDLRRRSGSWYEVADN